MNVNYEYFLWYVVSRRPHAGRFAVLDYGCGEGELVRLLRESGIDCVGVDVFRGARPCPLLADGERGIFQRIDEEAELPFPAKHFDLIVSNQVFEHVRNLADTLRRLGRVLKDDGVMYHHFPSKEVIREGHCGVPFLHWFPRGSRSRYAYTLAMRWLGFGYGTASLSRREWARRTVDWLDRSCSYRSYREIRAILSEEYSVRHREIEYIRFRGARNPLLRVLVTLPPMVGLYERLFRRLGFMALELRKRPR